MNSGDVSNRDQREFWSDLAGPKWVAQQQALDAMMRPVLDGVLQRAELRSGEHVLDIGCGAGTSTLEAAQHLGAEGHATGLDISHTLLDLAKSRLTDGSNASFIHADAATHPFDPHSIDHLISRFGVMFFDDTRAAFANMAQALRPGARMTCATWGAIDANPYFKLAAKAARDVLGPMPKSDPDAPGPFVMREPERVLPWLEGAGLQDVRAETVSLHLTPAGDVAAFAELACEIGPAQSALDHFEANSETRAAVHKSLIDSFGQYQTSDGMQVPAEIIFYVATA